jgi:hypothetical protein
MQTVRKPWRPAMRASPWANAANAAAMSHLRSLSHRMAEAPCTRARAVMTAAASLPPSGRRVGYAGGSVWPEPFCSLRPEFPQVPLARQDRSAAEGAGLRPLESSALQGIVGILQPLLAGRRRFRFSMAPPGTSSRLATFPFPRNAAFKERRKQGWTPLRESPGRWAAYRQDWVVEAAYYTQQGSREVAPSC